MSRSYRISVRECVNKVIRAEDRVPCAEDPAESLDHGVANDLAEHGKLEHQPGSGHLPYGCAAVEERREPPDENDCQHQPPPVADEP